MKEFKNFSEDEEMDFEELKKYFEDLNVEKMNYDDFTQFFEFVDFREEIEEILPGKGRVIDVTAIFYPLPDGKILGHEGVIEISTSDGSISFYDFDDDHSFTNLGKVSDNILEILENMYDS